MIGTGLIATPIASGRISPIADPCERYFTARESGNRTDGMKRTAGLRPGAWEREAKRRYLLTMLALTITETRGRVRLILGGFVQGEGSSLQEAADELIRRILELALAFRSSGCAASSEVRPDLETMNFLHELGEIAAAGGDIRSRVFA
jgi:hypothetical protein